MDRSDYLIVGSANRDDHNWRHTPNNTNRKTQWLTHIDWPIQKKLDSILTLLWTLSSAGALFWLGKTHFRIQRSLRNCSKITVEGQQVYLSDKTGPAVFGVLKPQIVFPRWILNASQPTRLAALAHENAHISAGDTRVLSLMFILIAAAPWNVPAWFMLKRLRSALEYDCDARVLKSGLDAIVYGEALLAAGRQGPASIFNLGMSVHYSQLERRIRIMLAKKGKNSLVAGVSLLAIGLTPGTYAIALNPPTAVAVDTEVLDSVIDQVEIQSDHATFDDDGVTRKLSGNVRIKLPASVLVELKSDSMLQIRSDTYVLQGKVRIDLPQHSINTDKATVTQEEALGLLMAMDSATVRDKFIIP